MTKTDDTGNICSVGDCSLREAVNYANAHGGSLITFDVDGTFELGLGELLVTGNVLILGNGAGSTIIDAGGAHRALHLQGTSANLVLRGVTVQNGFTADSSGGGGILNEGGRLYVDASVVRNNLSTYNGFWAGAGIASNNNFGTPVVEVNNSTIGPGNNATGGSDGGGLMNLGGLLTVTNSTISGNLAGLGGGLFTQGASSRAYIHQTTITLNHATGSGGGLYSFDNLLLSNSIVAGNTAAPGGFDNCTATAASNNVLQGRNILGLTGNCPNTPDDIIWSGALGQVLNPVLTTASNGVAYHGLVPGSPAIDAIPAGVTAACALPSYDQLDVTRPLAGAGLGAPACDIGAVEFSPASTILLPLIRR